MSIERAAQAEQALSELAERFEHWRQTRASVHERIPAPLWEHAIALSRVLPDSRVAKRLRLSQTDLKKRRLGHPAPVSIEAPEPPPPFVELTASPPWPTAAPEALLVEFERPDGARMRLRYPQSPPLAALVQAFLERA